MTVNKFSVKRTESISEERLVDYVLEHGTIPVAVLEKGKFKTIVGKIPLGVELKIIDKMRKRGDSQAKIAESLGVVQSYISKRLKLLNLVPELYDRLVSGKLKVSTAWELSSLPPEEQKKIGEITQKKAYTLRREHKLKDLDISTIETPELNEREVLASKLEMVSREFDGKKKKILLDATGILRR